MQRAGDGEPERQRLRPVGEGKPAGKVDQAALQVGRPGDRDLPARKRKVAGDRFGDASLNACLQAPRNERAVARNQRHPQTAQHFRRGGRFVQRAARTGRIDAVQPPAGKFEPRRAGERGDQAVQASAFCRQVQKCIGPGAAWAETAALRQDGIVQIQLQTRAFKNEKISFTWNAVVEEIIGSEDGGVNAVRLKDTVTGEETLHPTDGVFIFIGHDPNNAVFGDQIALNENGYIITDQRYRTNVEGVFAAGEIQDEIWRQVATSVGQGTSAAMAAIQWLEEHEAELQELDAALA